MTASDYIQIAIATVAGIAAILTGINIWFTNKHVNLQKKQWEFSYVPIFRISLIQYRGEQKTLLLIKNTNEVSHIIKQITFSSDDVEISEYLNGTLKGELENYKGLAIFLKPKNQYFHEGYLQFTGEDALGNNFKSKSLAIKFDKYQVSNRILITGTYFKNI